MDKFRIDLFNDEFNSLVKIIKESGDVSLLKKVENAKFISYSSKKASATIKASAARVKVSKDKIENAINHIRMSGDKITINAIVDFTRMYKITVLRYISEDDIISLNGIVD